MYNVPGYSDHDLLSYTCSKQKENRTKFLQSQPLKWLPALTLNPINYYISNLTEILATALLVSSCMYTCRCKNRLKTISKNSQYYFTTNFNLQLLVLLELRTYWHLPSRLWHTSCINTKKKPTMKIKILQLQYLLLTTTLLSWGRCPGRPGASTFGKASP